MPYYVFLKTEDLASRWELMEVVKSRGVASRALKAYEQMMGSQKVTSKEVVMVEADSLYEARKKLEQQDGETN